MVAATPTILAPERLLTADEVWRNPPPQRYELIRGVIVTMDPSGGEHGEISSTTAVLLASYIKQHKLGKAYGAETGFIVARNPDTVRGADFAFIAKERLPQAEPIKGFVPIAPDLAVEIVSPSDRTSEVNDKVKMYLTAGTRMVWVIEPKLQTVTVYRSLTSIRTFTANNSLSGEEVVPGFSCKVSELFE